VGGDLFLFHLTNALEPDELLREVWLPFLSPGTGHAFIEFARRHGDYALCGVCAAVEMNGTISQARLAYSGVATRPVRAVEAERALIGEPPSERVFTAVAQLAREVVNVADDFSASRNYRRHLVERLTLRALRQAKDRAMLTKERT
jgi:CO/xanthine dehydrogenase FAD-binding subunit